MIALKQGPLRLIPTAHNLQAFQLILHYPYVRLTSTSFSRELWLRTFMDFNGLHVYTK